MIIFICSKLNHLFWKLFTQYLFFWSSNLFTFTSMDKRKRSEKNSHELIYQIIYFCPILRNISSIYEFRACYFLRKERRGKMVYDFFGMLVNLRWLPLLKKHGSHHSLWVKWFVLLGLLLVFEQFQRLGGHLHHLGYIKRLLQLELWKYMLHVMNFFNVH